MKSRKGFSQIFGFLLSLIGAITVIVCFFIPWLKVKLVVKSMYLSGFDLSQESNALWIVPLLAFGVGIISLVGLKTKKIKLKRFSLITFSSLSIIFMLVILFSINNEMNSGIKKITSYKFLNGLWGVFLGFFIGFLGGVVVKAEKDS